MAIHIKIQAENIVKQQFKLKGKINHFYHFNLEINQQELSSFCS